MLRQFVAATSIGYVGLVVGGEAVIGASAGVAMVTNDILKRSSGDVYDSIIRYLER